MACLSGRNLLRRDGVITLMAAGLASVVGSRARGLRTSIKTVVNDHGVFQHLVSSVFRRTIPRYGSNPAALGQIEACGVGTPTMIAAAVLRIGQLVVRQERHRMSKVAIW